MESLEFQSQLKRQESIYLRHYKRLCTSRQTQGSRCAIDTQECLLLVILLNHWQLDTMSQKMNFMWSFASRLRVLLAYLEVISHLLSICLSNLRNLSRFQLLFANYKFYQLSNYQQMKSACKLQPYSQKNMMLHFRTQVESIGCHYQFQDKNLKDFIHHYLKAKRVKL